jgi:hypothetical protein
MGYGNWTSAKAAIIESISDITVANGFNYDWNYVNRTDIHQPFDIYVSMDTPEGEENTDAEDGGSVGTNEYSNKRMAEFYLKVKDDTQDRDIDDVVESCEDKLELALDDFKKKFNNDNNDTLCAAGVWYMQYMNMEWVTAEDGESKADIYAPIKMKVIYEVRYRQNRV